MAVFVGDSYIMGFFPFQIFIGMEAEAWRKKFKSKCELQILP